MLRQRSRIAASLRCRGMAAFHIKRPCSLQQVDDLMREDLKTVRSTGESCGSHALPRAPAFTDVPYWYCSDIARTHVYAETLNSTICEMWLKTSPC